MVSSFVSVGTGKLCSSVHAIAWTSRSLLDNGNRLMGAEQSAPFGKRYNRKG
jgi:hypothetical protein